MINNTAVRVGIVALLVPLTYLGANWVQASLDVRGTDMPDWTFHKMPYRLGGWQGEETKMDSKLAERTGAKLDTIIERTYRDKQGHAIRMHAAMFDNPAAGVIHSPMVCYQSQGWKKLSESRESLQLPTELTNLPDTLAIPISISTWEYEKENRKVIVVYWYQIGDHFLFGRWDLGIKIRWALAGKPKWPALFKVMLEADLIDEKDSKTAILGLSEQVAGWTNKAERRNGKGMLGLQTE
jgi:EpsI family protein